MDDSLSVVTWNVLAQAYVKAERYPRSSPDALAAEPRRQRLVEQLVALDADLYCLQEVEPDAFEAFVAALPGHAGHFVPKHARPDGAALIYRTASLHLHETRALHYDAIEPGYDHVAAIGLFGHRGRRFGAASTHLRWQRRDTPRERHLGRLQLLELLDVVDELRDGWPDWMVAGDFNALSESVVIQAALERGFRLSCRTQRPWDTVNIDGRRRKLDYLLYTPGRLVPHPGTLPQLERTTPMPSTTFPSDHLPVAVRFTGS
ncbi:MAG: endonuclease/exonuclease/phosphatase family protein [Myxococcota bacterium]